MYYLEIVVFLGSTNMMQASTPVKDQTKYYKRIFYLKPTTQYALDYSKNKPGNIANNPVRVG